MPCRCQSTPRATWLICASIAGMCPLRDLSTFRYTLWCCTRLPGLSGWCVSQHTVDKDFTRLTGIHASANQTVHVSQDHLVVACKLEVTMKMSVATVLFRQGAGHVPCQQRCIPVNRYLKACQLTFPTRCRCSGGLADCAGVTTCTRTAGEARLQRTRTGFLPAHPYYGDTGCLRVLQVSATACVCMAEVACQCRAENTASACREEAAAAAFAGAHSAAEERTRTAR